jgi:hypothetical protein
MSDENRTSEAGIEVHPHGDHGWLYVTRRGDLLADVRGRDVADLLVSALAEQRPANPDRWTCYHAPPCESEDVHKARNALAIEAAARGAQRTDHPLTGAELAAKYGFRPHAVSGASQVVGAQAIDVVCPYCKAQPGDICRDENDGEPTTHESREEAAARIAEPGRGIVDVDPRVYDVVSAAGALRAGWQRQLRPTASVLHALEIDLCNALDALPTISAEPLGPRTETAVPGLVESISALALRMRDEGHSGYSAPVDRNTMATLTLVYAAHDTPQAWAARAVSCSKCGSLLAPDAVGTLECLAGGMCGVPEKGTER